MAWAIRMPIAPQAQNDPATMFPRKCNYLQSDHPPLAEALRVEGYAPHKQKECFSLNGGETWLADRG